MTSNCFVMESRKQMYDTDSKYESNKSIDTNTGASDQYVVGVEEFSSTGSMPHSSLTEIPAVKSASSLNPVVSKEARNSDAPGKWDQVINAKDNLIQKKDNIIDRYVDSLNYQLWIVLYCKDCH